MAAEASQDPDAGAQDAPARGRLFLVSAPSGAGKTSLIEALTTADPSLEASVSHTTRPKRPGEVDHVHYHFVAAAEFERMRAAGEFLESARVFGHAYGTARRGVERAVASGKDVILEIDWQGAAQVRASWPESVSIFILPPSRAALGRRLASRGQDSDAVIERRTAQAAEDLGHHVEFEHLVVNDDFDEALAALRHVIDATRAGHEPRLASQETLLTDLLQG